MVAPIPISNGNEPRAFKIEKPGESGLPAASHPGLDNRPGCHKPITFILGPPGGSSNFGKGKGPGACRGKSPLEVSALSPPGTSRSHEPSPPSSFRTPPGPVHRAFIFHLSHLFRPSGGTDHFEPPTFPRGPFDSHWVSLHSARSTLFAQGGRRLSLRRCAGCQQEEREGQYQS